MELIVTYSHPPSLPLDGDEGLDEVLRCSFCFSLVMAADQAGHTNYHRKTGDTSLAPPSDVVTARPFPAQRFGDQPVVHPTSNGGWQGPR
jgi:hypothetical protein